MKKKIVFIMMLFMALTVSHIGETNAEDKPGNTPPKFISVLRNQVVNVGDILEMAVVVRGTPTPTITWYKGNTIIEESPGITMNFDQKTGTATLTIKEAQLEDSGRYEALATNTNGKAQSTCDVVVTRN